MMKVLLISANTLISPYPVYPLGLDYVAYALAASGHEVKITDMNQIQDKGDLSKRLQDFSPDIIGLSLRNIDNTDAFDPEDFLKGYQEIVQEIRRVSTAPLILGGSGFTIFPSQFMAALNADYGIIGEGERLPLLLRAIENQEDCLDIPGVLLKRVKEKIPPPWNHSFCRAFDPNAAHVPFYLKKGGMLNLQTQRGCPFKCIYCTYPHIEGNRLRFISPQEVAQTARKLQDAGAKYFFITDSAFNSDDLHSLEVARAFKKSGISIPWGAFFSPRKPSIDYYQIMADAGLAHVEFGTESLSGVMLRSYKKSFQIDHIFEAHEAANNAGLYTAHYFLLGGPGENSASLEETLSNIERLEKSVFFFFCGMRIYPYTDLYQTALKEGQISASQNLLKPVFYQTKAISHEDIIRQLEERAHARINWIIGAGGEDTAKIISRMYARGHTGPLWEYLIR